ncbi:MAG: HDOD domain-containing protein [Methylomonas lenta]|nr:HDOD domain-containing protein [Methylomonas lenta]
MNANATRSINSQINGLKTLPALPEASVKILEAINDPDISIEKLVDVLSLSPALTARLLGLANSAYFSPQRTIDNLHTAIVQVLGLNLVKSLAMGIVFNVQLDPGKCKNFDTQSFWQLSLMTAVIAQKLSAASPSSEITSATFYTGGLLLHIGILVVAFLFPDELDRILRQQPKNYAELDREINQTLGLSHYEIGYMLLNRWQLPDVYQNLLHSFNQKNLSAEDVSLIYLLQASQAMSGLVLDGDDVDAGLECIASHARLPLELTVKIFYQMIENKNDIQSLAIALGN